MIDSAVIFVNPTVPPTVTIGTPNDTVCAGALTSFGAIPVNGGFAPSYVWSVNGVNSGIGPAFSYVPSDGDVVKVVITSSPCAVPDTGSSSIVLHTVSTVMPAVSAATSTGTNTVCAGHLVTFAATPTFGGTSPTYRWYKNGVAVATGPYFTYAPANGDIVGVTMRSTFDCRAADSVSSTPITMTTVPVLTPVVGIVAHPGASIAAGQTATLTATVSSGGSAPTYQWKVNGIAVPGATSATFISSTFANGDAVSVTVTSSGPCTASSAATVHMSVGFTGIGQVGTDMDIRLTPNPNDGVFTVKGKLANASDADVYVEILDMLGQVVYKGNTKAKQGNIDTQITLSNNLANGMYTLRLTSGDARAVFHFVLEQ
jgi:hypothetical protein